MERLHRAELKRRERREAPYLIRIINPDKWTPLTKRLIWRCCFCRKTHHVKFKVVKNVIYVKEWRH